MLNESTNNECNTSRCFNAVVSKAQHRRHDSVWVQMIIVGGQCRSYQIYHGTLQLQNPALTIVTDFACATLGRAVHTYV